MSANTVIMSRASDALRSIARSQGIKKFILKDDVIFSFLLKAARRYIGGIYRNECLEQVSEIIARGHATTVDYMGEATNSTEEAAAETREFNKLIEDIDQKQFNSSISLDLSHLGLDVSKELAYENVAFLARAAKKVDREIMISMEGSERTDLILDLYRRLCHDFDNVGITIQARLHRTATDLPELLNYPGKIRLVKGAYDEPASVAVSHNNAWKHYIDYARLLLQAGRRTSFGTHDDRIFSWLEEFVKKEKVETNNIEFEVLMGLGNNLIDQARDLGFKTRIYCVYGDQWFLYLCHRLAEQPERLFQAIVDMVGDYAKAQDINNRTSSLFPHR